MNFVEGKISHRQIFFLVTAYVIAPSVIPPPGRRVGQDAWLPIVLGALTALIPLLAILKLLHRYPNRTLIQIHEVVFGQYLGKLLSFLVILYFLGGISGAVRGFTDFINARVLFQTPAIAIALPLTFLAGWAAIQGLETIARCAEILVPLLIIVEVTTDIILVPQMHLEYATPMLQTQPKELIWETYRVSTFPFGLLIVFTLVLPFANDLNKINRTFLAGASTAGLLTIFLVFRNVVILGPAIAQYPSYAAVGQINIGDIFTRLEVLVSSNFMTLGFIKVAIIFYAVILSIGQLCSLRSLKPLFIPVSVVATLLSLIYSENNAQQSAYLANIYPIAAFPFQYLLPVALLAFSYILPQARKEATPNKSHAKE